MTLMAINKSTTDVPQRPHLHLHHQNQTTCEEWKQTCYNFTTLPILLSKCLIILCQHTYETKIKTTDSLTPGVGYRKEKLYYCSDSNEKTAKLKSRTLAHPEKSSWDTDFTFKQENVLGKMEQMAALCKTHTCTKC